MGNSQRTTHLSVPDDHEPAVDFGAAAAFRGAVAAEAEFAHELFVGGAAGGFGGAGLAGDAFGDGDGGGEGGEREEADHCWLGVGCEGGSSRGGGVGEGMGGRERGEMGR